MEILQSKMELRIKERRKTSLLLALIVPFAKANFHHCYLLSVNC